MELALPIVPELQHVGQVSTLVLLLAPRVPSMLLLLQQLQQPLRSRVRCLTDPDSSESSLPGTPRPELTWKPMDRATQPAPHPRSN